MHNITGEGVVIGSSLCHWPWTRGDDLALVHALQTGTTAPHPTFSSAGRRWMLCSEVGQKVCHVNGECSRNMSTMVGGVLILSPSCNNFQGHWHKGRLPLTSAHFISSPYNKARLPPSLAKGRLFSASHMPCFSCNRERTERVATGTWPLMPEPLFKLQYSIRGAVAPTYHTPCRSALYCLSIQHHSDERWFDRETLQS